MLFLFPVSAGAAAKKVVFVGDSYSTVRRGDGVRKPWTKYFCEIMGIAPENARNVARGGHSFGRTEKRFANEVKYLKKDTAVTDVIVLGGINNDYSVSLSAVAEGMRELDSVCEKRFPNARIVYGFCNWDMTDKARQNSILARTSFYRKNALELGWIYLRGLEPILRGHGRYFIEDHHHPTQKTQVVIANNVAKLYKRYCVRKVAINETKITMRVGETIRLRKVIYPGTAQNIKVTWTCMNPGLADITQAGRVTAKRKGTARVRIRSADGGHTAFCTITIK